MKLAGSLVFIAALYLFAAFGTVSSTKLTYYWVVHENEFKPLGTEAELRSCDGKTLFAKTNTKFADRIAMEGSGYLRDDKTVLNLSSCISNTNTCKPQQGTKKYHCFEKVKTPVGDHNNPLVPWVSVATNNKAWPYKTTAMIPQLKGKKLPNGKEHNGCVRVDDSCSTCTSSDWIDFYVLNKGNYEKANNSWKLSDVTFQKQSCAVKSYE